MLTVLVGSSRFPSQFGGLHNLMGSKMARFYIDTDDGSSVVIDEDGTEYRDLASAEDIAMRALPEMAQSCFRAREARQFSATVRDDAGVVRFRASLALNVERVSGEPALTTEAAA